MTIAGWTARLAAAPIALAAWMAAGAASAQDKISVRLDFSPWGVHAGMHLAKNKGWFKEAGLDVDIQDGRGSGNTIQLVNAGQVDVGQVQLGLVGSARAQGSTIKAIAGFQRKTDLCILVDKDSAVAKVADLKGKTVVVFAASPWAPFIDSYLKAGGLTRNDVKVDFVDPAALWGTYTAKRADGLMSTVGSALPVAEKPRPSKCLLASDAGIEFPSYGLVAKEETIASKGAALKKLIAVQQRAWKHAATNLDEAAQAIIAERPDAKLDAGVLKEQARLTIEYFDTPASKGKPLGWQAEADWAKSLQAMEAAGVVKPGWKATDYFTNALVE